MHLHDVEHKSGTETAVGYVEHEDYKKAPLADGLGGKAHIFQGMYQIRRWSENVDEFPSEDSTGKVTGRLLLPRPTADPNDPLVSSCKSTNCARLFAEHLLMW